MNTNINTKENFMEITLNELKDLIVGANASQSTESDYIVGSHYTIMTVLGWYKGTLTKETDKTLTLINASWVASTQRFSEYVKDDKNVKEEEPFMENQKVIIERTSVIGSFLMPTLTRKLK